MRLAGLIFLYALVTAGVEVLLGGRGVPLETAYASGPGALFSKANVLAGAFCWVCRRVA